MGENVEVISPELVLVDPELRARARALLRTPVLEHEPPRPHPTREAPSRPEPLHVPSWAALPVVCAGLIGAYLAVPMIVDRHESEAPPEEAAPLVQFTTTARAPEQPAIGSAVSAAPKAGLTKAHTVETRLFVWVRESRAHHYHVQFFRGHRLVYEAWPTPARVTVPLEGRQGGRAFEFRPGTYRWVVRPAFGTRSKPRYGAPIVRSTWFVSRSG